MRSNRAGELNDNRTLVDVLLRRGIDLLGHQTRQMLGNLTEAPTADRAPHRSDDGARGVLEHIKDVPVVSPQDVPVDRPTNAMQRGASASNWSPSPGPIIVSPRHDFIILMPQVIEELLDIDTSPVYGRKNGGDW